MKTIAVINQKGGVGKTACAYNLAYSFASHNERTLIIDLDPSANTTKGLLGNYYLNDAYTISELLTGNFNPDIATMNVEYDEKIIRNLRIIPSHIRLAMAHREMASRAYRETILSKIIQRINEPYSYIFIDCSPTLNDLTVNAIYAADLILIPVTYEDDALEGLSDLFTIIKEIKENQRFMYKILRNQKDSRKSKTNEYIEKKLQPFEVEGTLLKTIIRQDEAINQAKIERKPIFLYAPNSHGAIDFTTLTQELIYG